MIAKHDQPKLSLIALLGLLLPITLQIASAAPGSLTRISVNSSGVEGNGESYNPRISSNGRFITFTSNATNLVPNDTNNNGDVFVAEQIGSPTRIYLPILTHAADRS
ncbi:MAG: hypothetical protein R3C62_08375 [Chloroflexota bacterium]